MGHSITDYLNFLIFNMDIFHHVFYTLEMSYGFLFLALLLNISGLVPYRILQRFNGTYTVHAIILVLLMLQWFSLPFDGSGWGYIISLFVIIYVGVTKTILYSFEKSSSPIIENLSSFGLTSFDYLYKTFCRTVIGRYLYLNNLFFLGLVLFSEIINDLPKGFGPFTIKLLKQNDYLLSVLGVACMLIPVLVLHFVLRVINKRLPLPEGVLER